MAAVQRQAAHWRQIAETKAAEPLPEPPTPVRKPPSAAGASTLATRKNSVGIDLIRVPAGKYQRGARDGEGTDDEKPQHWVQITNAIEVGKYEVTQAIYTQVMGKNPSWFSSTGVGKDKVSGMDTSDFPPN